MAKRTTKVKVSRFQNLKQKYVLAVFAVTFLAIGGVIAYLSSGASEAYPLVVAVSHTDDTTYTNTSTIQAVSRQNKQTVTTVIDGTTEEGASNPVYSSDHTKLAWHVATGTERYVRVQDTQTNIVTEVGKFPAEETLLWIRWYANNTKLAVMTTATNGLGGDALIQKNYIWTMNVDGGNQKQITLENNVYMQSFDVTADGKYFVYSTDHYILALSAVNFKGGFIKLANCSGAIVKARPKAGSEISYTCPTEKKNQIVRHISRQETKSHLLITNFN